MLTAQVEAQMCYALRGIVSELGGLAHEQMPLSELDMVIDSMLSKGIPNNPSVGVSRWIHQHRKRQDFKIAQILGAHVNKDTQSIIAECFGKFNDPEAVECKACLDFTLCGMKTRSRAAGLSENSVVQAQYPVGQKPNIVTIQQILSQKWGQMSKALANGTKVVLEVNGGNLKVSSVGTNNKIQTSEDTIMPKKPIVEEDVELEEELDLSSAVGGEDDLGGGEEEEEEEAAPVTTAKPATSKKPAAAAATEAAAPAKPAKPAKVKPVLNENQTKFKAQLDSKTGEDKWKYSKEIATKLKLPVGDKADERINHMTRVMAINKKLGESKPAAAPAKK